MNSSRKAIIPGTAVSAAGALCCAFIYYCEKLQFFPFRSKACLGRLGIAFLCSWILLFTVLHLIREAFGKMRSREWLPVILASLIISVCAIVWFPIPRTGLYPEHTLTIRAIPDKDGIVRPVTLTWLHPDSGDVPLSSVRCESPCIFGEFGPTISDADTQMVWKGKTGNLVTIEFAADAGQGIAVFSWDEREKTAPLNNEDLDRLSFDHAFPPADTLPEFIAVFAILFLISIAGLVTAMKSAETRSVRSFGIAAFICFTVFRVIQFSIVKEPLSFIDSGTYLGLSRMTVKEILSGTPFCHIEGWHCIARPVLVPLLYKLCRQDIRTITLLQLGLSIISWGYFARHAAGILQSGFWKKAVLMLSFGLGCIPNVTRWDQMIMSESISFSASLLFMGSLFRMTKPSPEKRWQLLPAVCTAVSALLYSQSRDSAAWVLLPVIILLLCICRRRSQSRIPVGLSIVLAGICWLTMGNTGTRWVYSYENVLFGRILRDIQSESFFISEGMPTPPGIEELYGQEHVMVTPLFNSEQMTPLREWILSDGLKTYIRYMLHSPFKTLRMTWYAGFEKEAFQQTGYTFSPTGFKPLLPDTLISFFSCNIPGLLAIGIALYGIFAAFKVPQGDKYTFPLLFILSAYILSSGTLIADEYEAERHMMGIILMMKASLWVLIAMIAEDRKTGNL